MWKQRQVYWFPNRKLILLFTFRAHRLFKTQFEIWESFIQLLPAGVCSVCVEVISPLRAAARWAVNTSCCYLLRQPPSAPLSHLHHYWDVECRKNAAAGSSDCTLQRETSLSVAHRACSSTADPNHFKNLYLTSEGTQRLLFVLVVLYEWSYAAFYTRVLRNGVYCWSSFMENLKVLCYTASDEFYISSESKVLFCKPVCKGVHKRKQEKNQ